jgi:hypothetical protein
MVYQDTPPCNFCSERINLGVNNLVNALFYGAREYALCGPSVNGPIRDPQSFSHTGLYKTFSPDLRENIGVNLWRDSFYGQHLYRASPIDDVGHSRADNSTQ